MQKYLTHIIIWSIGSIISVVLALHDKSSVYNIAILWGLCALYYILYYFISVISIIPDSFIMKVATRNEE